VVHPYLWIKFGIRACKSLGADFGKMYLRDCTVTITWLENQIIDLIEVVGELQTQFMLRT